MHRKNKDREYKSTLDAMSFWPEKQTSIGARPYDRGHIDIFHCFNLNIYFNGHINYNPIKAIKNLITEYLVNAG